MVNLWCILNVASVICYQVQNTRIGKHSVYDDTYQRLNLLLLEWVIYIQPGEEMKKQQGERKDNY